MSRQPARVVDLAARNDESHEGAIYRGGIRHGVPPGGRAMMRPMSRDFSTIGVIGLGTMGAGIAEVFARNGYQVVGVEQSEETLKRGRQHVEHSTGRAVKRVTGLGSELAELWNNAEPSWSTSMAALAMRLETAGQDHPDSRI